MNHFKELTQQIDHASAFAERTIVDVIRICLRAFQLYFRLVSSSFNFQRKNADFASDLICLLSGIKEPELSLLTIIGLSKILPEMQANDKVSLPDNTWLAILRLISMTPDNKKCFSKG